MSPLAYMVVAQVNVSGGVNTILGWVASLALLAVVVGIFAALRFIMGGKMSVALGLIVAVGVFGWLLSNPAKVVNLGGSFGSLFGI